MLETITEKVDNMHDQMSNFSREMETAVSVNLKIGQQKSPKLNHEGEKKGREGDRTSKKR